MDSKVVPQPSSEKGVAVAGLVGRRVLVVEDEHLVSMMLEEALQDAGCIVLGPIPSVANAVLVARAEAIDAALLDLNLAGKRVYPVADVLIERKVPFIFMTGYGRAELTAAYAAYPAISKPFMTETVLALLSDMLDHGRGVVG